MITILAMLTVQSLLGAFDNLWHHEITEDLPHRPEARLELALHSAREFLYAVIFGGIAWARWDGLFAFLLMGILAVEITITLWDFVIEDQTRRLPKFERVLHTVLAINFGAILAVWLPELLSWAAAPTGLTAASYGTWSWVMTVFAMGVLAWGFRDLAAVVRLGTPTWLRHPIRLGRRDETSRTILVTGGTGFVGRALVRSLLGRGERVIVHTRSPAKAADMFGPAVEICSDLTRLEPSRRIDAVVNLAGEPLAGGLWTRRRMQRFRDSRLGTTQALVDLIARLDAKPTVLISGSAIGYYGDRGGEELTEASAPQEEFTSNLCRDWEAVAQQAEAMGVRVCRLRIGLVLGADGGALQPMVLTTRLGLGAVLGSGENIVSWIHRVDLVRLIEAALDDGRFSGAINAVAPHPLRHAAFMTALGRSFHRPILFRFPAWLLRTALGGMSELFLASQNVQPVRALEAGFAFRFADLEAAFTELFGKSSTDAGAPAVAVYVNKDCVLCRTEMAVYERAAQEASASVSFCAIGDRSGEIRTLYGLADNQLRRRLYAIDQRGELVSGVGAFIAIYRELPRYRWLAKVVASPAVQPVVALFYDGICVPVLGWWNGYPRRT